MTTRTTLRTVLGAALLVALATHASPSLAKRFWVENTMNETVYARCAGASPTAIGAKVDEHFNCTGSTIEAAPTTDATDWQSVTYLCSDGESASPAASGVTDALADTTKVQVQGAYITYMSTSRPFVFVRWSCRLATISAEGEVTFDE